MLSHVGLVRTNVSEELVESIFRVERCRIHWYKVTGVISLFLMFMSQHRIK
jgi:hypothetical protein